MNALFFLNNLLLGLGLSMDAFSVSMANGLNEPDMRKKKILGIASIFGGFQGLMPVLGWFCIHTILRYFKMFQAYIPWIALFLLSYIGGHMIWNALQGHEEADVHLGKGELFVQGIATSIDALSVGFAIAKYDAVSAFVSSVMIAVITFIISFMGVVIGKKMGMKLAGKATLLGGVVLIIIGLEICISSLIH